MGFKKFYYRFWGHGLVGVAGEGYCKIPTPFPFLGEGNQRRPSQSAGTQWEAENRWGQGQSEVVFAGSLNYSKFPLLVFQNWSAPAEYHLWLWHPDKRESEWKSSWKRKDRRERESVCERETHTEKERNKEGRKEGRKERKRKREKGIKRRKEGKRKRERERKRRKEGRRKEREKERKEGRKEGKVISPFCRGKNKRRCNCVKGTKFIEWHLNEAENAVQKKPHRLSILRLPPSGRLRMAGCHSDAKGILSGSCKNESWVYLVFSIAPIFVCVEVDLFLIGWADVCYSQDLSILILPSGGSGAPRRGPRGLFWWLWKLANSVISVCARLAFEGGCRHQLTPERVKPTAVLVRVSLLPPVIWVLILPTLDGWKVESTLSLGSFEHGLTFVGRQSLGMISEASRAVFLHLSHFKRHGLQLPEFLSR
ncbi:hypothetical protein L345_03372, partial [Ophiophagus hannah]